MQLLGALQMIQHEMLLFAAFWFIVGALDEFAVDICYLWLRHTGRLREVRIGRDDEVRPLAHRTALFVPSWQESPVIAQMIAHTCKAWSQDDLTIYVGCYRNDAPTIEAAMRSAARDRRVRLVMLDRDGPTTKADCLNRIYAAMCDDEDRSGHLYESIVFHDAEDMVHPAALSVIDAGLMHHDFVQLPVRPEPQLASRWIAGHYADEFAEAHGKTLAVRSSLGAAIPAAGVGCGFSRERLGELAARRSLAGSDGPFARECLTEDYELGLTFSQAEGGSTFLRARDAYGEPVATRAFFPARLRDAVRQKTRWIHGIAFQGWDRMGWSGGPVDIWMALRDRRGPLTAIVLAVAYLLLLIEAVLGIARLTGWQDVYELSDPVRTMIAISFGAFVWRSLWRFAFTANAYGLGEGLRAVLRIPIANVISIMAGRRAFWAYARTLRGGEPLWDKTAHDAHPATDAPPRAVEVA